MGCSRRDRASTLLTAMHNTPRSPAEFSVRHRRTSRGELGAEDVARLVGHHAGGRLAVVGRGDEYVVEDAGCTCADVEYNLDPEDPTDLCWHAIAAKVAHRIGVVDHHDMWYSDVREFL